jgi:hypothetical protein
MVILLAKRCIQLEAQRGLTQQLSGHGQVGLGPGEVDVAQVRGQERQASLNVGAFAVPRDDAVNRKGMP